MHYEINVTKNGKHFFATHARSATTSREAAKIYQEIATRFPESEGFGLTVTEWRSHGSVIAPEDLQA
jgi:hypothetical protein